MIGLMKKRRGAFLMEAVVAFFLVFVAGISMFTTLHTSDRAYTQAIQIRVAARLAEEGLESVRAGNIKKTVGTQTLSALSLKVGRSGVSFRPEIVISISGSVLLVRSRVRWTEARRNHQVELKSYVAP